MGKEQFGFDNLEHPLDCAMHETDNNPIKRMPFNK